MISCRRTNDEEIGQVYDYLMLIILFCIATCATKEIQSSIIVIQLKFNFVYSNV